MIGSVEPDICTEMLRNLTEKLRAKLLVTTHGYSMVNLACIADALLEFHQALIKHSRRSSTAAKRYKKRRKSTEKIEKWKAHMSVSKF